jgi:MFS transporter, DHA2 family, multidrug resistance protein
MENKAHKWIGLAVLLLPCMVYSMDLTILNLALPSISAEFKPSAAETLWIVDIYGFMVAGFLILMGAMGDKFGRRRVLMIGAFAFALTSLMASLATSTSQLIIARALLGIAGATLAPSTLSLISLMFKRENERLIAMSLWISSYSVGAVLGPLVGGVIITYFSWQAAFWVGIPVMLLLLICGRHYLPEYIDEKAVTPDVLSVMLSLFGIISVIYGMKTLAEQGIALLSLVILGIGILCLLVFIKRQKRINNPLLDLSLFKSTPFKIALMVNMLGLFFMFGSFIFLSQYFQLVVGLTPMQAGLWSLPSAILFTLASFLTPHLAKRFTNAQIISSCLVISSAGFFALAFSSGFYSVLASSIVFFVGLTPVFALTTDIIIQSAPPERVGVASAISETAAELGGALGIALLGSLMTFIYRSSMNGVSTSLTNVHPHQLAQAKAAFMSGFSVVALLSAIILSIFALIVYRRL